MSLLKKVYSSASFLFFLSSLICIYLTPNSFLPSALLLAVFVLFCWFLRLFSVVVCLKWKWAGEELPAPSNEGLLMDSIVFSLIITLPETEVEELRVSPGHDNTSTIQHTCGVGWRAAAPGQSLRQHVEEVFHSAERPAPPMPRPRSHISLRGAVHHSQLWINTICTSSLCTWHPHPPHGGPTVKGRPTTLRTADFVTTHISFARRKFSFRPIM